MAESKTYIALLRGINVSGKNKLPMAELRSLADGLGWKEVQTYIQSGNLIFRSASEDLGNLSSQLMQAIHQQFGYEVPILILSVEEWSEIVSQNPFLANAPDTDIKTLHVTLLASDPDTAVVSQLQEGEYGADRFQQIGRHVYLHCPNGYGRTKLTNTFFERKLKVQATTRNWRTILKLQSMIGS